MKVYFSLYAFLFLSCYSLPEPDWVNNHIVDAEYWYGYGIVNKEYVGNVREEARSRAIEEIATQISIDISSNFQTTITEFNFSINEYTEKVSRFRLSQSIENLEIVDSYKGLDHFFVLMR